MSTANIRSAAASIAVAVAAMLMVGSPLHGHEFPDDIKRAHNERVAGDIFWRSQYERHRLNGGPDLARWLRQEIDGPNSRRAFISKQRAWLAQMEETDSASAFAAETRAWIEAADATLAQRQLELIALEAPSQAAGSEQPKELPPPPMLQSAKPPPAPSSITDADLERINRIQHARIAQEAAEHEEERKEEAAAKRKLAKRRPPEPRVERSHEPRGLLCCDGTLSPTCSCSGSHRGCCSWHGGVCGCQ